jgi:hypothetical protein
MALTFSKTGYSPGGSVRPVRSKTFSDLSMVIGEFTMDSSYASGGESLAASDIDLEEILFISFSVEPSAGATNLGQSFIAQYDYNNAKVMALGDTSGGPASQMAVEIPNGTNLSAFTVRFVGYGRK